MQLCRDCKDSIALMWSGNGSIRGQQLAGDWRKFLHGLHDQDAASGVTLWAITQNDAGS